MPGYTEKIKEIAARLLNEGTVDMVIGFRRGTLPMMNEPCFAKTAADTASLVWDSHCGVNLANYLAGRKEKIGIVAKGCDSRNIVGLIVENKIQRDQLHVIGVPCQGMIDRHQIAARVTGEILSVEENGGQVIVRGDGFEETLAKADVLQENCALCTHRNPVVHDELVADPIPEQEVPDKYADVSRVEAMSADERRAYFDDLISTCIRCYACRNACPLCYCPTCFVDESRPQWVGKSQDPTDIKTFHFLRAYHCAGRCTDCGACERACPMGIKVREFTKKLNKDCLELYNWEAGLSLEERPPLDTYRPDDPEEFIR